MALLFYVVLIYFVKSSISYTRRPFTFSTFATRTFCRECVLSSTTSSTIPITRTFTLEKFDSSSDNKNPPLLFLPGLDGQGNYSYNSMKNLTDSYSIHKVCFSASDRTNFLDIATAVADIINGFGVPVVLMGESFGGLLALYLASSKQVKCSISKLVLINPATSYDRTIWPVLGPLIANTGPAYPLVGLSALMLVAVEPEQFQRIGNEIVAEINSTETAVKEITKMVNAGLLVPKLLPPETLVHRLNNWLGKGCFYMDGRYDLVEAPTLLLVGQNDRLLPSKSEGTRLKAMLRNAQVDLVESINSGHAVLDGSIDLQEFLKTSVLFQDSQMQFNDSANKKNDANLETNGIVEDSCHVDYPSEEDIRKVDEQFGQFKKLLSPIFLSRGQNGVIRHGLVNVPTGRSYLNSKDSSPKRPVLLVGNHQLYGADLYLLVRQFMSEKDTLIRGLAHPAIFQSGSDGSFGAPSVRTITPNAPPMSEITSSNQGNQGRDSMQSQFKKFGAVEVSPSTYFQLLKRNETILLFPGGVKEAYHGKNEQYKLFWPEKLDFIRMAALFDAIVVPFSSIGIADSVNMVLDANELMKLPFIGQGIRTRNALAPQARAGVIENFVAPLVIPSTPARNYFLFHEPYDTKELNYRDKKKCKEVYDMLKSQVEQGLSTLQEFRENDPYKDFLVRQTFELLAQQQAPTASLNTKKW